MIAQDKRVDVSWLMIKRVWITSINGKLDDSISERRLQRNKKLFSDFTQEGPVLQALSANPPNTMPLLSLITDIVLSLSSHNRWKSAAAIPSRDPRYNNLNLRNISVKPDGKKECNRSTFFESFMHSMVDSTDRALFPLTTSPIL